MTTPYESRLIQFLRDEFNLASQEMAIALKHPFHATNLPTILWQYGIIDSNQLGQVFDWLEQNAVAELG